MCVTWFANVCVDGLFKGIFIVVDNQKHYGILVNSENFEEERAHGDLYSIFDNRQVSNHHTSTLTL